MAIRMRLSAVLLSVVCAMLWAAPASAAETVTGAFTGFSSAKFDPTPPGSYLIEITSDTPFTDYDFSAGGTVWFHDGQCNGGLGDFDEQSPLQLGGLTQLSNAVASASVSFTVPKLDMTPTYCTGDPSDIVFQIFEFDPYPVVVDLYGGPDDPHGQFSITLFGTGAPEPAAWLVLLAGFALLGLRLRRPNQRALAA